MIERIMLFILIVSFSVAIGCSYLIMDKINQFEQSVTCTYGAPNE